MPHLRERGPEEWKEGGCELTDPVMRAAASAEAGTWTPGFRPCSSCAQAEVGTPAAAAAAATAAGMDAEAGEREEGSDGYDGDVDEPRDDPWAELATGINNKSDRLGRDFHQTQILLWSEREPARTADQLRNRIEALLHRAYIQIQEQEREIQEAGPGPGLELLDLEFDVAAEDGADFEGVAQHLRVRNEGLEVEIAVLRVENAQIRHEAELMDAELRCWRWVAVS